LPSQREIKACFDILSFSCDKKVFIGEEIFLAHIGETNITGSYCFKSISIFGI
jgi:hypothetical protein